MDTRVRVNARDLVGLITTLVLGSSALSSSAVTTVSASLDRSFHFRQRYSANHFPVFVELINNRAIRVNKLYKKGCQEKTSPLIGKREDFCLEIQLWLPKTPSELKMQWFRAFVRSWWYHDELSFGCPFRFGHLQFSIPCRPAGGDPRASSSTRGFPEECTAAFAPPALRPAFVGLAVTMVARLTPGSTHRSPRYSDRLAR